MNEEPRPIEDARLKSLRIEGFKCFADTMVPLANLTVLAGGNSVGKSSVIQALLLMRSALKPLGDFQKYSENFGSSYRSQVNLNDTFLMQLGTTKDIVTNGESSSYICFTIENKNNQSYRLSFEVPFESESYLIFRENESELESQDFTLCHPEIFRYLNAERIGPRPFYNMGGNDLYDTGWQGEYTVQILSSNLYDRIKVDPTISFGNSENPSLGAQVNDWMNYIIPGTNLNARKLDEINKSVARINNRSPHNVGFGISYVLPIVVSGLLALPNTMFIVENPEAHLHPAGQSRIGQFLAQVASAGVQVVVETHSEHVINGIRIAALNGTIPPKDVVINFFHRDEADDEVKVNPITINESGDLSAYPKGFFDQEQRDMAEIVRQKRKRMENKT